MMFRTTMQTFEYFRALAILWGYIERVCNGEPIEDTFFGGKQQQADYEI